jgi:hypothetical protein
MKIRKGFVSNSSSSSFLCDVCGKTESGFDACLSDVEMSSCENGHTYCDSHTESELTIEQKRDCIISMSCDDDEKERLLVASEDEIEELADNNYEIRDCMPAFCCPCCLLKEISPDLLLKYILHERGQTKLQVEEEIKKKYNNYADAMKDLEK